MANNKMLGVSGLNEFKAAFTSVRPTLFRVSIQKTPSNEFFLNQYLGGKEGDVFFYIKAATLPASTVNEIEVGYMGRKFYEHGDREFDPWELTVYNSQDFATRSFFESWMDSMNLHEENRQTYNAKAEGGHFIGEAPTYFQYMLDLKVQQLDRRNNVIYTYDMINCFPTKVGEIQLDYGQTNTIEEFPVTLRYTYWTSRDREDKAVTDQGKSELQDTELAVTGLGV